MSLMKSEYTRLDFDIKDRIYFSLNAGVLPYSVVIDYHVLDYNK